MNCLDVTGADRFAHYPDPVPRTAGRHRSSYSSRNPGGHRAHHLYQVLSLPQRARICIERCRCSVVFLNQLVGLLIRLSITGVKDYLVRLFLNRIASVTRIG